MNRETPRPGDFELWGVILHIYLNSSTEELHQFADSYHLTSGNYR